MRKGCIEFSYTYSVFFIDVHFFFCSTWLICIFLPQEGLTVVENRTADIIQETRKLHIRKKSSNMGSQNQTDFSTAQQQPTTRTHGKPQMQADLDIQLKASRDVRWQLCITGLIW